jgi:hypothetical protein
VPSPRAAAAIALTALGTFAAPALAHQGNPNYSSQVRAIEPAVSGLEAQILGNDDRVELRNGGDAQVIVKGYRDEPYLRFNPDGTVEVNRRSPATYLNEDRFAQVDVPPTARPGARPRWEQVAENGRYDWHDHRIHWMSKTAPEQVREDESRRAKIFDWKLPIVADGRPATISGSLTWLGKDSGGIPIAAVIALLAIVLAGPVFLHLMRRRRQTAERPQTEAW